MHLTSALGGAVFLVVCAARLFGQSEPPVGSEGAPPLTWIDADTGHRVWRLSAEPNASGIYFNINAFSADKRSVVYIAPDGIHVVNWSTRQARLLVSKSDENKDLGVIAMGRRTNVLYFIRRGPRESEGSGYRRALCKVSLDTGEITSLGLLPLHASDWMTNLSINADETLLAGLTEDGPPEPGSNYSINMYKPSLGPDGKPVTGLLVQGANKGEWMESRRTAHIPLTLFTLNLRTGEVRSVLQTKEWITHIVFSPTNPSLLMYCHEGEWTKVDRLWLIHADGTDNSLIHKRQMVNEICGHEFWDPNGATVWYDLQMPGGLVRWLAGYNAQSRERVWYHMEPSDYSIHYNSTSDGTLFCGDGCDVSRCGSSEAAWIKLFRPGLWKNTGIDSPDLIRVGTFRTERLVNMAKHNYSLEPNVRFTPDKKMVLFTSNLFGPSYYFGVEVDKDASPAPH